ncbi:hypothetical protein B0H16DRAFT_1448193 [Mycena metata]|uniref:Uncharacterized protein n=1 Tax=Mycena metata TaxID=1033252 RepID=A0AAD7NXW9_9AGAR|nr:hypothetical protein B0H16DRAFT_1448193 [Mycena metata]
MTYSTLQRPERLPASYSEFSPNAIMAIKGSERAVENLPERHTLGTVKTDREGVDIENTAPLQHQSTYFYVYEAANDDAGLKYAVDLDVIKARSQISGSDSSFKSRSAAFKESLLHRDASCIFTDGPFHKGDEWFDLIVENRPQTAGPDEDVSELTTVDDRRNGMLLGLEAHVVTESRKVVVGRSSTGGGRGGALSRPWTCLYTRRELAWTRGWSSR